MDFAPLLTAPDEMTANMWVELLANNGITAFVSRGDGLAADWFTYMPSTVMVPESQLEEARRILGRKVVGRRPRRFRKRER